MLTIFSLSLALVVGAQSAGPAERMAIHDLAVQRHGADTRVTSVLISGPFALIRGTARGSTFHEGLRLSRTGWHVSCTLGSGPAGTAQLGRSCGFSQERAAQLAADEAVNAAAERGRFAAAAAPAQTAYAFSAPPAREAEAARVQLLRQLSEQLRMGQITRADAIRKWNEMRFSFYVP